MWCLIGAEQTTLVGGSRGGGPDGQQPSTATTSYIYIVTSMEDELRGGVRARGCTEICAAASMEIY
jgi:hypothetical protein